MPDFKFVSPGVTVEEIDNSQIPKAPGTMGPMVIGRSVRGPGMRPVKVSSFSEFIEIFGNPSPGGNGGDVWRDGNQTAPTYAAYAAKAWLANGNSLTFMRVLGTEHDEATAEGKAGWKVGSAGAARTGGAYGLFVWPSASAGTAVTGTLAAVWYLTTGSIVLSGTLRGGGTGQGNCALFEAPNKEFKAVILDENGATVKSATFNMSATSDKFVRKVFNTNPTLTNGDIVSNPTNYWLGETYETYVNETMTSASAWHGAILALKHDDNEFEANDFQIEAQASQTGWFFSQRMGGETVNLFKFHSLEAGEWNQKNLKISIKDIKTSTNESDPYGTFTVEIRKMTDTDEKVQTFETFVGCNLNRNSVNFIGRKIGDKYVKFNSATRRNVEYGEFDNRSKFVRVEVSDVVDAGTITPTALPFGVYGPLRYAGFTLLSGSNTGYEFGSTTEEASIVVSGGGLADSLADSMILNVGSGEFTGSVRFPSVSLRGSTATGSLSTPSSAYFGVYTQNVSNKNDKSVGDMLRVKPVGVDSFSPKKWQTEISYVFSLDDIKYVSGSTTEAEWSSGSFDAGTSINAVFGGYSSVLDAGFNRFTTVLAGGTDGFDITEKEPLRNTAMEDATEKTSYAYNSLKEAIDIVRDPEEFEYSVVTMPGITNEGLTGYLLTICETRGDAMAIIDLKGDYQPAAESAATEADRLGNVDTVILNLKNRAINSSYGEALFPWVQIRDDINNMLLWAPPSVVGLGALAYNDRIAAPWFAPAGFSRGGLTAGAGGIPVVNVRQKLSKSDRDKLYAANINPIASFPNEGILIWGQKTLQVTPSALDRVNVRRLLIEIKKTISRFAATTLFQPNVRATWDNFKGMADPYLRDVTAKFGLQEYRLILDESTTTPDLIDRNAIYAKLLLKPTKSAEFFHIDFNIESSGASFDD